MTLRARGSASRSDLDVSEGPGTLIESLFDQLALVLPSWIGIAAENPNMFARTESQES